MNNRKTFRAVIAAAALSLVLTACSQSAGSPEPSGSADEGTGSPEPTEERIYVEALNHDPAALNPQFGGGPLPLRVGFAMLEPLVEINDQYEIHPVLARDWEVADDGLTITFHLQEGVQWHDGEPFSAEDVVFNFEEIMPLQTFGAQISNRIERIQAPDDHTVTLELSEQYGPFFEALSQQAITPKHLYEGTDYVTNPHNLSPIGTGPMKFESYEQGSEIVLVRNPDWWRDETEVDRAIYPIMPEANSRALAMLNGEVDSTTLDPSRYDEIAADPDLVLTDRGVFPQMVALTFNSRLPELESAQVRALLFAAIDLEAITRLALNGLGEPADTFYPDALSWMQHPDISFAADFPRDIEHINAELDRLGFPRKDDGYRFSLDARYVTGHSEAESTAEVIKAAWEEIGVQLNLEGAAQAVWQEAVWGTHDFGINILRNTVGADPSIGTTTWLHCNPTSAIQNNPSGVCDDQLQEAATAAMSTLDREERAAHFHVVQERARELIYWAPLSWYYGSYQTVNTSRWAGLDELTGQTSSVPWAKLRWIGE